MCLTPYAPNVHTGGGRTLLIAMLKAIPSDSMLILDQRLSDLEFSFKFAHVFLDF